MAGALEALLFTSGVPTPAHAAWRTVPLAPETGLTLLPLTSGIVADLIPAADDDGPVTGFYSLTGAVARWAAERSAHGAVAYLHTEFFGGGGFHAAMAWRDGAAAWGPCFTATSAGEAEDHYTVVTDRRDMAVNALLRWLRVRTAGTIDEFAAAGLNRCRWTEEWAELAGP